MKPALGLAVLMCGLLLPGSRARAHDFGQSESIVEPRGTAVAVTVTFDLLTFAGVDDDRNGKVSYQELDDAIADVFTQLKAHLRLQGRVPPSRITLNRHDLVEDEHVLRLEVSYIFPEALPEITVTSSLDQLGGPDHQHLVTAIVDGVRTRAVLNRASPSVTLPMRTVRFTVARVAAAIAGFVLVAGLVWLRIRRYA